jgi:hypothetical protein
MKYHDPIVEEIRDRGRHFTARFENDPKRIMECIRLSKKKNKGSNVSKNYLFKNLRAESYSSCLVEEKRAGYKTK